MLEVFFAKTDEAPPEEGITLRGDINEIDAEGLRGEGNDDGEVVITMTVTVRGTWKDVAQLSELSGMTQDISSLEARPDPSGKLWARIRRWG